MCWQGLMHTVEPLSPYQKDRILSAERPPSHPNEIGLQTLLDWRHFISKYSPSATKILMRPAATLRMSKSSWERWDTMCGMALLMSEWNSASKLIRQESLHPEVLTIHWKGSDEACCSISNIRTFMREMGYYLWNGGPQAQTKLGFERY